MNDYSLKIDASKVCKQITDFIETQVKEMGDDAVLVWFSGRIDSTIITKMCFDALGKEAVKLIIKPQKLSDNFEEMLDTSVNFLDVDDKNIIQCDVEPMVKKFGSEELIPGSLREIPILNRPLSYSLLKGAAEYDLEAKDFGMTGKTSSSRDGLIQRAITLARTRSRIQMSVAYYTAETENRSLVGTVNKTELYTGLFTKFGTSHAVDMLPLGNLFRTQILELAEYLEIPKTISSKRRSDLLPGIENKYLFFFDLTAFEVDTILILAEKGFSQDEIHEKSDVSKKAIKKVIDFLNHAAYTRGAPLIPKF